MKSRKNMLMLILVPALVVAFMIYSDSYKKEVETKYNQFIASTEGRALVVRCLFHFEGIDFASFDHYMRFRAVPEEKHNQDLQYKHRIETALEFALKEFQKARPDARQNFINTLKGPLGFKINGVYYEEYETSGSLDEKLAVISVLLKHESRIWNNPL